MRWKRLLAHLLIPWLQVAGHGGSLDSSVMLQPQHLTAPCPSMGAQLQPEQLTGSLHSKAHVRSH